MAYYLAMSEANIFEAKDRLSELVSRAEEGQTVYICRRNVRVAELRAVTRRPTSPRPLGLAKGKLRIPESFLAPLPDALVKAFQGR